MPAFPPVPAEIKGVAHFLKVAEEHDERNIVVSYWARMHTCQVVMKLVPGKRSDDVSKLLISLLDWLESTKQSNRNNEGIADQTVGHALIEEYAIQLFSFADAQDRACNFNKNVIKAFYTAGILMDILEQFGNLSEDIASKRKYAKWKAAYIHNCLKVGDIPLPGGPEEHQSNVIHKDDIDDEEDDNNMIQPPPQTPQEKPSLPTPPPPNDYFNLPPPTGPINPVVAPAPAPSPVTPSVPVTPLLPSSGSSLQLNPDQVQKAQKYCKFATSALNYDDIPTAINNLTKALNLLQTGRDE